MKLPCLIFIALLSLGLNISHAQTLYKSVGADGKVTYSDKPPTKGSVQKTLSVTNLPSSKLSTSASKQATHANGKPMAGNQGKSVDSITLFTASWCGYCRQAKSYLSSQRISYREVDIETEYGMAEFSRAGGAGAVPLLIAGKESVQGFSPDAYDEIFKSQ